MTGCITEYKHHLVKAAEHLLNALPGRKKCPEHFFKIFLLLVPQNPFNLGIRAKQLARHQTEHVGDTNFDFTGA